MSESNQSKGNKASLLLAAVMLAASLVGAQATGKSTFKQICTECHSGGFKGLMSGAPNINRPSTWQKYLERDSVIRMQEILLNGTRDHKRKGGCDSCSDQQIINALNYLLKLVR